MKSASLGQNAIVQQCVSKISQKFCVFQGFDWEEQRLFQQARLLKLKLQVAEPFDSEVAGSWFCIVEYVDEVHILILLSHRSSIFLYTRTVDFSAWKLLFL